MPVTIVCPNVHCGASAFVSDDRLGRDVRCTRCGCKFPLIPGTRAGSSPPGFDSIGDLVMVEETTLPPSFGRFRVIRELGRGGMGTVYLAEDPELGRPVALKVPHLAYREAPEVRERLLREARAAALFRHPNFCPIHDIDEADGVPYLRMSYIEGRTLASTIEPGRPWPERRAAEVVRQLALALAEAHRRGVIHRDLKPANVMVDTRGKLVIMDFGLALRLDAEDPRLTTTGAIVGTPAYMPPEQVEGHHRAIGPRSDLYSLGVILYELLTGRRPFEGSAARVLGLILVAEAPPPSDLRANLDPRLEAICLKAMAKRPEDRHPSMDELADALRAWLAAPRRSAETVPDWPVDLPAMARVRLRPLPRRRGPAASLAAASMLAAILAATTWFATRPEPETTAEPEIVALRPTKSGTTGTPRPSPKAASSPIPAPENSPDTKPEPEPEIVAPEPVALRTVPEPEGSTSVDFPEEQRPKARSAARRPKRRPSASLVADPIIIYVPVEVPRPGGGQHFPPPPPPFHPGGPPQGHHPF